MGNPPSKSNSYSIRGGHFYKKNNVSEYEKSFALQTLKVPKNLFNRKDSLSCKITWYRDSRRQDIDNIIKVLWDCMQNCCIIPNDRQFQSLSLVTVLTNDKPYVIIEVWKE
jgi:Holliday junction resolvase RusA-like endonuclease